MKRTKKEMSRLQAIDIMFKYNTAAERDDFIGMCLLTGLTEEMVESMSLEEVLQTMSVRLADIARLAGMFE